MKVIREVTDRPLQWTQPALLKREYELHAGDEVVATLRWQKTFGSLALAETAEGAWTFKRSGFLRPKVTVRVPGSESETAVFNPSWGGEGTLRFSDGRCYLWQHASFWRSEWVFANEAGEPLAHFKATLEASAAVVFCKHAAEVKFEPRAAAVPDLSLLTVLGWYLMVLMSDDAAGATTTLLVMGG
jgi:hypothetical protein